MKGIIAKLFLLHWSFFIQNGQHKLSMKTGKTDVNKTPQ